jgi:tetratricopeptide (TPR) repeat protein
VDKSLVSAEEQGGVVRYRLLETVRQYAAEKLDEAGETSATRERHGAWCLALAEAAEAGMYGPDEVAWLRRLDAEHDNLRAALGWLTSPRSDAGDAGARLAAALPRFWELRGHLGEGRRWLARALEPGNTHPAAIRAGALQGAGILAYMQGDFAAAAALFEDCLDLWRTLGRQDGIAEALGNLGRTALRRGDGAGARDLLASSLAIYTDLGHRPGMANIEFTLGVVALRRCDYAAARERFEASLALNRELGNREGIANALEELATVFDEQGERGPQDALLQESLAMYRELDDRGGVAAVLGHLGMEAWGRREYGRAMETLQEALALYRAVDDRRGIARLLGNQSLVALSQRDYARATTLCRQSLTLYHEAGDAWAIARYLPVLAGAALGLSRPERAARLLGAAEVMRERLNAPLPPIVRTPHERTIAALRVALGAPAFASAWEKGRSMATWPELDEE